MKLNTQKFARKTYNSLPSSGFIYHQAERTVLFERFTTKLLFPITKPPTVRPMFSTTIAAWIGSAKRIEQFKIDPVSKPGMQPR